MMKGVAIALLVVLAMVELMARPGQAIDCGQVDAALAPCMPYLTGSGSPSGPCCDGARNLKSMTPTKADRQAVCNCAKEAAARYQNIKDDAAQQLPQKCGVQTNIPISRTTDCASVA
uniref:Non-specific lipid-transfer protein n=1 Tax=Davidia involucrata TaxID=16924 RepID=A0A5B7CET5_DAVIN